MSRFASLALVLAACSTAAPGLGSEAGTSTGEDTGGGWTMTAPGNTGPSESGPEPTTSGAATTSGGSSASDGVTEGGTGTDGGIEDYGMVGEAPVGNSTFTLVRGERTLAVEVWYPADRAAADAAAKGHSIAEFVPPGPERDALVKLLMQLSPQGMAGTRTQTSSARDAAPSATSPYPLVVLSHCHNCARFSMFSIAEHLASRGFVVAAPDHAGNTLLDELKGESAGIDEAFLEIRVADEKALLDALLDPAHEAVPAAIRGSIDPTRIGAMGHSYGAATVGRLAQEDDRVRAVLPIAAPVENPFFPNTQVAAIAEPSLYVLAVEDNSILQIGNDLIESNFKAAATPSYLVRIRDAGHWGPTDICGLVEGFNAGCGPGTRMTDGTEFTYLDPHTVRAIVAGYAAAFFDLHLNGNYAALSYLQSAAPGEWVEVEARL